MLELWNIGFVKYKLYENYTWSCKILDFKSINPHCEILRVRFPVLMVCWKYYRMNGSALDWALRD